MSIIGWWKNATVGANYDIKRRSKLVGEDEWGNKYFEESKVGPKDSPFPGRHRRYVIYNGPAEPSRVSADWHGWLHHTFDNPPTEDPLPKKSFETPHQPNLTGTIYAYKPKGSLSRLDEERTKTAADYEAWDPDA